MELGTCVPSCFFYFVSLISNLTQIQTVPRLENYPFLTPVVEIKTFNLCEIFT